MFSFSLLSVDIISIRKLWSWLQTKIFRKSFPDDNSSPLNGPKLTKEEYIKRYKDLLDDLKSSDRIIATHWAFVTDAGIIEYEKSIRRKPEYDKGDGLEPLNNLSLQIASKINRENMPPSNNMAFMVYGFGNAIREQYVIDKICEFVTVTERQSAVKVIFIDISYYYFSQRYWSGILDQSKRKYNQLFKLLDFIYDKDEIKKLREGLKKSKVIHLFMGNIAGNYEERELRQICQEYTQAGDYLLMEYGEYDFSKMQSMQSDNYQHAFATEALKEIYQKEVIANIKTKTIIQGNRIYIEIEFSLNDSETKKINSFLRRNFDPNEFSKEKFSTEDIQGHDCGQTPCGQGKRKITLYRKL